MSYDGNGHLVARHNLTYEYDVFGRIQRISSYGETVATMFYQDFVDEIALSLKTKILMQIRGGKEIIRYFYGFKEKPFQITAIFSTAHGWRKLFYDDQDRLFAMKVFKEDSSSIGELYYILTDLVGTPTHILNSTGKLENQ